MPQSRHRDLAPPKGVAAERPKDCQSCATLMLLVLLRGVTFRSDPERELLLTPLQPEEPEEVTEPCPWSSAVALFFVNGVCQHSLSCGLTALFVDCAHPSETTLLVERRETDRGFPEGSDPVEVAR